MGQLMFFLINFNCRNAIVATESVEKSSVTCTLSTANKWQPPVIKGRFSKIVWVGNPSEMTLPPPPIHEYSHVKK